MKKIAKNIFFYLVFLFCYNSCFSQDTTIVKKQTQHTIFFELGGNAMFYNITYDCTFNINSKNKIALGIGVNFFSTLSAPYLTGFSPQINYLYGKKHHLELGVGINFSSFDFYYVFIPIRIGYRYQKKEGGLFWKVAFTPLIFISDSFEGVPFFPWGGVSIGYTFKNKK